MLEGHSHLISKLYLMLHCRMLSGAQNTFVYMHVHQNGSLDVRDNIQVLHLTPVSHDCYMYIFAILTAFIT